MKFVLSLIFILSVFSFLEAKELTESEKQEINELSKKENLSFEEADRLHELQYNREGAKGGKFYERIKYYRQNRMGLNETKLTNKNFTRNLWKNANRESKTKGNYLSSQNTWQSLGPNSFPNGNNGVGRANVVRIHPKNSRILYTATAGGGMWKSTNHGESWTILPNTELLSMTYSDMVLCRSNPNVIYAATGDSDATFWSPDDFYSIGVIKSTDGGNSWEVTNLAYEHSDLNTVSRVLVDYNNPDIVLAATKNGIYKSIDGGSHWELKTSKSKFKDMDFHPFNSDYIVASTYAHGGGSSIFYSSDMGETWEISTATSAARMELSYCQKDPNYLYALGSIGVSNQSSRGGFHSLLFSEDFGETWSELDTQEDTPNILGSSSKGNREGGQGGYDLALAVNPANPAEIHTGGIYTWKRNNSGNWTFTRKNVLHADQHFMNFNKAGDTLYIGNDGGVFRFLPATGKYEQISNNLNIMQFYRVSTSDLDYSVCGAQDNGTSSFESDSWSRIGGGDGMDNAINQKDNNFMYISSQNGFFSFSTDKGKDFSYMISGDLLGSIIEDEDYEGAWVTPIALDPQKPETVYIGYKHLWRHENYGLGINGWEQVSTMATGELIAVAVAPTDSDVIYIASSGVIYKTTNGGAEWELLSSNLAPITYLAVDPENANRVFVTSGSYIDYKKVNLIEGNEIYDITGNLPNVPVNTIVYQKGTNDRLYVGTDLGVYYTENNSAFWQRYGNDLPHVNVMDLDINEKSNSLYAATYGRGLWKIDLLDCNPNYLAVRVKGETELCKGDSVVLESVANLPNYYWSTGATTKSITVKENGLYSLMSSSDECSHKSEYVEVKYYNTAEPKVNTIKTTICPGDSTRMSVGNSFINIVWNDGSTEEKRIVKEEGDYFYTALTEEGCEVVSDTVTLSFYEIEKPVIIFTDSVLIAPDALEYKWFKDGLEMEDETNKELEYTEHGIYSVEIKTSGRCYIMSYNMDTQNPGSVIEDYGSKIIISPNPSSGIFNIKNTNEARINYIKVYDLNSKLVKEIKTPMNEFEVNLEAYPSSTYFIEIQIGNYIVYKSMVKK